MIIKIKEWCEGIIVAVIISVIIEMIAPESKNKKYIKVIIGIYIMFVTLLPILELLNYDFNFGSIFETETFTTSQNTIDIKEVYIKSIESALKSEIEELGYSASSVKIYTDIDYENIEKIELKIIGKKGEIEKIAIGDEKENIKYNDIIEMIKQNYLVDESKIIFK